MGYDSLNRPVFDLVPPGCAHVLDLGCGGGLLGAAVKEAHGCRVTGVTFDPDEAALARTRLDAVAVEDLNRFDPATLGRFDCVICSHVLEHLYRPDELLVRVRNSLTPGGALVVGLPNVLFWRQRVQFLRGRFRYTDGGLMDRTHYRFFDWHTARELLTGAAFAVEVARADGGFPLSRFLLRPGRWLDRTALSAFPGLFGWQFVFRARPS